MQYRLSSNLQNKFQFHDSLLWETDLTCSLDMKQTVLWGDGRGAFVNAIVSLHT